MPVVEVKWLKGRDRETKAKIAQKIENAMQEDAGCPAGATYVIFSDVEKENWAKSGELFDSK